MIKSAIFEAEINNTITFELRDDNGNVIDDTTHTVIPGIQQLILNFDCPIGTNFQLGTSTNNTGLFRITPMNIIIQNIGNYIKY